MRRTRATANQLRFILLTLAAGAALGIAADRVALAQQGGIKRTVLRRADDPGGKTHELVLGLAELGPGATSGKHKHNGIEIGYVLEGSVVMEHAGRMTTTLMSGDTFRNDGAHTATNKGTKTVKILAAYLVEKGKPLSEPVK